MRGANDSPLSANLHSLNSDVPALDDITLSKAELERRTILSSIKLFVVVLVSANVVNRSLNEISFRKTFILTSAINIPVCQQQQEVHCQRQYLQ